MLDAEPTRLLLVLPTWVGDAIMATPAIRLIRASRPGALVGVLARPGIDTLLEGTGLFDEAHVERAVGMMAPKSAAAKVRMRRYNAAVLFKNSFSAALAVRMAGIPRRVGYARDARGMLLTDGLSPPMTPSGEWAIVPAVEYYLALARFYLGLTMATTTGRGVGPGAGPAEPGVADTMAGEPRLELAVTPADELAGAEVLARAGLDPLAAPPLAVLNPGGNNEAKRWPIDRFAAVADFLAQEHGLVVLVNGSPGERPLAESLVAMCAHSRAISLPSHGVTLGALKAITSRCRIMVTNDTGPRHIAAALGVPVVSLFGPTDHRWTSIPTRPLADGSPGEVVLLADPTLPESESANDHPERCRIERIGVPAVLSACARLLGAG